jgi:signal transduction histidine kinase
MVVAVAAAALASLVGIGVSLALDADPWPGPALSAAVVLAFAAVGAVIAFARPDNRIGWLMLAGAALWALGNAGTDAAYAGLVTVPGSLPAAAAWALAGSGLRGIGWWLLVLGVPVLFPTGRVSSPRWRWLTTMLLTILVCSTIGAVFAGDANLPELHWHNPIAAPGPLSPVVDLLSLLSLAAGAVVTVGGVLQLRARWRAGGPLERQQLLLFAAAAVPPVVAGPLSFTGIGSWLFSVCVLPLPIAVGFAVLARGLYDLRTAVNRTLVWGCLSAVVVGIYALVIAGVSRLLDVGRAVWLPWLAAAVVAVAFAPLRDAAQHAVNRLTFGRWDEPYAVLAALGQQVEASGDVERLIGDVVAELRSGLGLADVVLLDAGGRLLAGTPGAGPTERVPLTAYGEPVGELGYRPPTTPLRARDRRLIDDLAVHLGGLLHAHRLTEELQRARERLVLGREEERRRLRRDLHDGLGPALASHLLQLDVIAGQVGGGPGRPALETLRQDVQATILEVRRVVEGLRPPALDELGLAGALTEAVRRLTAGTGIAATVRADGLPAMPAAMEVAVFRIVTEAVTNVVRHAGAAHCSVRVTAGEDGLTATVCDDGQGLDGAGAGHGLDTMRERAEELRGCLTVSRSVGTTVTARFPLRPAVAPLTPVEQP